MKLSPEECQQKALTPEHLALALRSLHESGYVILERVLPHAWVEEMRVAFDPYHVCTEERAAQIPSARVIMPAGSVVVRDMRAWHRGMPNHTQTIRTMLALVYFRQFYNICHLKYGNPIPRSTWEQLSERAQRLYRYTPAAEG